MGAWGHGLFENDFAGDTVVRITDPATANPVQEILRCVASHHADSGADPAGVYWEGDEVNELLVYLVLIVGFKDRRSLDHRLAANSYFRDRVDAFIRENQTTFDELVQARHYVAAEGLFATIYDPKTSETAELWEEAGAEEYGKWRSDVESIEREIRALKHSAA